MWFGLFKEFGFSDSVSLWCIWLSTIAAIAQTDAPGRVPLHRYEPRILGPLAHTHTNSQFRYPCGRFRVARLLPWNGSVFGAG